MEIKDEDASIYIQGTSEIDEVLSRLFPKNVVPNLLDNVDSHMGDVFHNLAKEVLRNPTESEISVKSEDLKTNTNKLEYTFLFNGYRNNFSEALNTMDEIIRQGMTGVSGSQRLSVLPSPSDQPEPEIQGTSSLPVTPSESDSSNIVSMFRNAVDNLGPNAYLKNIQFQEFYEYLIGRNNPSITKNISKIYDAIFTVIIQNLFV